MASTTVCGMEYRRPGGSSRVALFFNCISLAYVLPINVVLTVNSVINVVLVVVIKEIVSIVVDVGCNAAEIKHSIWKRKLAKLVNHNVSALSFFFLFHLGSTTRLQLLCSFSVEAYSWGIKWFFGSFSNETECKCIAKWSRDLSSNNNIKEKTKKCCKSQTMPTNYTTRRLLGFNNKIWNRRY